MVMTPSLYYAASTQFANNAIVIFGTDSDKSPAIGFSASIDGKTLPPKNFGDMRTAFAAARKCSSLVKLDDRRLMRIGGLVSGDVSDDTVAFHNPQTGSWSIEAAGYKLPSSAACVVLLDSRVLITGGEDHLEKHVLAICLMYNPKTKIFTPAARMNTQRAFHAACLLPSGCVFACGGIYDYVNPTTAAKKCEVYNPEQDKWHDLPDMLFGRSSHACRLLDANRVFILGGAITGNTCRDFGAECEIYDIAANTFTLAAPMPQKRAGAHVFIMERKGKAKK